MPKTDIEEKAGFASAKARSVANDCEASNDSIFKVSAYHSLEQLIKDIVDPNLSVEFFKEVWGTAMPHMFRLNNDFESTTKRQIDIDRLNSD